MKFIVLSQKRDVDSSNLGFQKLLASLISWTSWGHCATFAQVARTARPSTRWSTETATVAYRYRFMLVSGIRRHIPGAACQIMVVMAIVQSMWIQQHVRLRTKLPELCVLFVGASRRRKRPDFGFLLCSLSGSDKT